MKTTALFSIDEAATVNGDVIQGVVICGRKSKNGREYSEAALKGALKLYEGMAVYADHLTKEERTKRGGGRRMEERLGHLEGVHWAQDGKPRGNLRLLESHPLTPRVKEAYAKGLPYFGLSHVVDGTGHVKEGVTYVESIDKVISVDLVDNAATGTLTEQAAPEDAFCMAIQALLSEPGIDKDSFLEKAGALWDSLKGDQPATPAEGDTPAQTPAPAMEQTIAAIRDELKALHEALTSATKAKPAVYTKPKAAPVQVTEQTASQPGVPSDRKALASWLRKSN